MPQKTVASAAAQSKSGARPIDDSPFVITRMFAAPRDLVFKAWTQPEHLRQWWGPKGFTVHQCKVDLRPGGAFHYCLKTASGEEMWGKFAYREIVPPERLVYLNSFSDPQGNAARHAGHQTWPLEIMSVVTFDAVPDGTRVTVRWTPHEATEAERRVFDEGRSSMTQGWGGTLDQLDEYLNSTKR